MTLHSKKTYVITVLLATLTLIYLLKRSGNISVLNYGNSVHWQAKASNQKVNTLLPQHSVFENKSADNTAVFIHSVIFDRIASEIHVIGFKYCSDECQTLTISLQFTDLTVQEHVLNMHYVSGPVCHEKLCALDGFTASGNVEINFTKDNLSTITFASLCSQNERSSTLNYDDVRLFGLEAMPRQHNLSICVQPMNNFIDWTALIQFIEVWREVGCTKFHIYVSSVTPLVQQILDMYSAVGIVEVVPWSFQPGTTHHHAPFLIHHDGYLTAYRHCMLRSRFTSKYVGIVDTDELPMELNLMGTVTKMFETDKNIGAVTMKACLSSNVGVCVLWGLHDYLFCSPLKL